MQGLDDIDFFDESLYGHEIQKSETEEELLDETIHDEYEDKEKMEFIDEKHQQKRLILMKKNLENGKVLKKIGKILIKKITIVIR